MRALRLMKGEKSTKNNKQIVFKLNKTINSLINI